MRKKMFFVIVLLITTFFSGHNIYKLKMPFAALNLSNLALANIEALADPGEILKIGCDSYSVIIRCQYMCTSCYRLWTTSTGYGNSTGLKGQCTCGSLYY